MSPIIQKGDYVLIEKISKYDKFVCFWDTDLNDNEFGYKICEERNWVKASKLTHFVNQVPRGHFWIERINRVNNHDNNLISHAFIKGNVLYKFNFSDTKFFQSIDPNNTINT